MGSKTARARFPGELSVGDTGWGASQRRWPDGGGAQLMLQMETAREQITATSHGKAWPRRKQSVAAKGQ